MPLSASKYTWYGRKKSRIDRAIINQEWNEGLQWHLISLSRKYSDHRPLLFLTKMVNWGSKPFKAFNIWIQNEKLGSLINEQSFSNNSESLWVILKKIKKVIKEWNLNVNGDINFKIKEKEEELERVNLNSSNNHGQSKVFEELQTLYREKTTMLIHKSCIRWDSEGDCNSRFFHLAVKYRTSVNSIKFMMDSGVRVSDPEAVKNVFF